MVEYLGNLAQALVVLLATLPDLLRAEEMDEGKVIMATFVLAIFTAVIAFVFSQRRDWSNHRHAHSSDFYNRDGVKDSEFGELAYRLHSNFANYCSLEHDEIVKHSDTINKILVYYERLSIGISVGYLAERYVVSTERFKLLCAFISLGPAIEIMRRLYRNPRSMENFQTLFIRTYFPEYSIVTFPAELVWGRPIFFLTAALFWSEYRFNQAVWWVIWPAARALGYRVDDQIEDEVEYVDSSEADATDLPAEEAAESSVGMNAPIRPFSVPVLRWQWKHCRRHFWVTRGFFALFLLVVASFASMAGFDWHALNPIGHTLSVLVGPEATQVFHSSGR